MEEFIEIQNWGINTLTISFIITLLLTIFQWYGFAKQNQKIWKKKSTESLSAPLFFFLFFNFISLILFGQHKHSLAIIFNGLLFLPCLPLVAGLIKFKKLSLTDVFSFFLAALSMLIMIIIKQKDAFFFVLSMVSLGALATQLIAMIKSPTRGAVEIKFIIISLITSVTWLIYSIASQNWALEIFNLSASLIYGAMAFLYQKRT